MIYEEWRGNLFEDVYPKALLAYGDISFERGNGNALIVCWGNNRPIKIKLEDFYYDDSINPLDDIKKWIYKNMPFIQEEIINSYVVYNHLNDSFDAYIHRPMDVVYPLRNINPTLFSHQNNRDATRQILEYTMGGTVLAINTKIKEIPATLAIANHEFFKESLSNYMDYNVDLVMLLPDSIETNKIFVGHENSITRLSENFPSQSSLVVKVGDWFNMLQEYNGEKNV